LTGTSEPLSSASSITTLSKASAEQIPSQTDWSRTGTSSAWASCADISSTRSSIFWFWAAEATSWAIRIARAACLALATSASSSASSACQASGSSVGSISGMKVRPGTWSQSKLPSCTK
jgi:hypothetical protein